jgi:hypothetical protein
MPVDSEIIERIIQLKMSGLGYRRISTQLKKEGLADISKSTVANLYTKHVAEHEKKSERKLEKEKEYLKLKGEVEQLEQEEEKRKAFKNLYLRKANTIEGCRDIFRSNEKLLQFTHYTIYGSEELGKFDNYCLTQQLPLAKTLSVIVGSYERYITDPVRLDEYIRFQLKAFFKKYQEKEKPRL